MSRRGSEAGPRRTAWAWVCRVAGAAAAWWVLVTPVPATGQGGGDWTSSPVIRELHAKARAEGQVVIWGSDADGLDWIPAAFGKRFPGVQVSWAADRAATTRLIAESRAGRHTVDVLSWSIGGVLPLHERGMLAPNEWARWGVRPDDLFFDSAAAATHNLLYAVVYNSERLRPADLPTTWEGFLAPRFRNVLVTSEFLMPRFLSFLALSWGETRALDYFRALRDQANILVVGGNAPRETMLGAGERLISLPDFPTNAANWRREGVPVAWAPLSPTGAGQFVSVVLAKAPHPHAARLLAGWLAADEGKAAAEELRAFADLRPGSRSRLAAETRALGVSLVYEDVSNMKRRIDLYTRFAPFVSGHQR